MYSHEQLSQFGKLFSHPPMHLVNTGYNKKDCKLWKKPLFSNHYHLVPELTCNMHGSILPTFVGNQLLSLSWSHWLLSNTEIKQNIKIWNMTERVKKYLIFAVQ